VFANIKSLPCSPFELISQEHICNNINIRGDKVKFDIYVNFDRGGLGRPIFRQYQLLPSPSIFDCTWAHFASINDASFVRLSACELVHITTRSLTTLGL